MVGQFKEVRDQEKCIIGDQILHLKLHFVKSLNQLRNKTNNNPGSRGSGNIFSAPKYARVKAKPQPTYVESSRVGNSVLTYPNAVETLPGREIQLTAQKPGYSKSKSHYPQVTESKKKSTMKSQNLKENLHPGKNQTNFRGHNNQQDTFLSPIKPLINHNLENIAPMDLTDIEKESIEIENRINRLKKKSEIDMYRRSNKKKSLADMERM
jgi:hypothetical protein